MVLRRRHVRKPLLPATVSVRAPAAHRRAGVHAKARPPANRPLTSSPGHRCAAVPTPITVHSGVEALIKWANIGKGRVRVQPCLRPAHTGPLLPFAHWASISAKPCCTKATVAPEVVGAPNLQAQNNRRTKCGPHAHASAMGAWSRKRRSRFSQTTCARLGRPDIGSVPAFIEVCAPPGWLGLGITQPANALAPCNRHPIHQCTPSQASRSKNPSSAWHGPRSPPIQRPRSQSGSHWATASPPSRSGPSAPATPPQLALETAPLLGHANGGQSHSFKFGYAFRQSAHWSGAPPVNGTP